MLSFSFVLWLYIKTAIAKPTTQATAIIATALTSKPVIWEESICGLIVGSTVVLLAEGTRVGVGLTGEGLGVEVGDGGFRVGCGEAHRPVMSESRLLAAALPSIDMDAGATTSLLLSVIDCIWAIQEAPL